MQILSAYTCAYIHTYIHAYTGGVAAGRGHVVPTPLTRAEEKRIFDKITGAQQITTAPLFDAGNMVRYGFMHVCARVCVHIVRFHTCVCAHVCMYSEVSCMCARACVYV